MSIALVDAPTVQHWLHDGQEIAFIDVREAGLHGLGHPLLAVNLPYSRLELDIAALVPRHATRTVLLAASTTAGTRAASRLQSRGYTRLHVLDGGAAAWQAAGLPLFQGVNVPSKAFAEFVEHVFHTPAIEAQEVRRLQDSGADLVVLDSRTAAEYRRFHVPGAISCPGSELVLRIADLAPSPQTLVVVSCAGRTRGIMGAQTLIDAGIPNRVAALSGGTQGWRLAGLALETTGGQEAPDASPAAREQAAQRAAQLAERHAIGTIDAETLARSGRRAFN
ncbi:MAG: Thiosulfate sulfurtransferase GlpE [Paracidovorax wautersii]|uniref:Thiosulfate sulfurtransferase GlpE n=1 Tax=Paracidovorax wautersii TaxID=1177982 RepID=A0A7V8JQF9_9BURK|nr:MAG: Thiosulfate sulfurtransferase GlpE [Paracidovorax wautersii]